MNELKQRNSSRGERARDKVARIPVKVVAADQVLPKPDWIRVRAPGGAGFHRVKRLLREQALHTVCEEASCPNIAECFSKGTATFMIMGELCTRRCPFCDVAHGRPDPLDPQEPQHLAEAVRHLDLNYVVITSVDRDDLKDGGAAHFVACIAAVRQASPKTRIEVLVPDFRGRMERALGIFANGPPDVFNHNIETVPRLYKAARPGSDYRWSLELLRRFKADHPGVPTTSGIMVGLGETDAEVTAVLRDLREHAVDMVTIGQYLQPSRHHLPVTRYVPPAQFDAWRELGKSLGFAHVASGPLVRSSYHADRQAEAAAAV